MIRTILFDNFLQNVYVTYDALGISVIIVGFLFLFSLIICAMYFDDEHKQEVPLLIGYIAFSIWVISGLLLCMLILSIPIGHDVAIWMILPKTSSINLIIISTLILLIVSVVYCYKKHLKLIYGLRKK